MGHLVNAKATRIGWSTTWCDQWYSELQYYPEYLHSIFRIRHYLVYIFTRRHFDKKAILYSHFELKRHYKNLYVEVYLYSGKLESDYEDYKFNFFYRLYNMERNKDPETREPMFLYMALKLVLIFDWLHFFSCKAFRKKDLLAFIIFLREYKVNSLAQYLRKLSSRKYFLRAQPKPMVDLKKRKYLRSIMGKYLEEKPNYLNVVGKLKKRFLSGPDLVGKAKEISWAYKLDVTRNVKKSRKRMIGHSKLRKIFKKVKSFKKNVFTYSKSDVNFFILLFISFASAKIYIGKASVWKQPNRNTTLRRFYMAGAAYKEMSLHLRHFSIILGFTFQKLTNFSKVFVSFFLTNNNCVNAKFLSRFIGRKLKQNYPLRELLSPIRKELLYIIMISRQGRQSYIMKAKEKYFVSVKNMTLRRSLFKMLLGSLFLLYRKQLGYYFAKNKTWLNLEMIMMFVWFGKSLTGNARETVHSMDRYYANRCGYLCFFEYRLPIRPFKKMFMPKIKMLYAFSKKEKFFGFFNMVYNSIYTSKLIFFDLFYFDVSYRMPPVYLRALFINYNRYLKFNYWQYNYHWVVIASGANHLKSRAAEFTRANHLRGYKMHLVGRFTRKQRAASYWFSKGKVPLNTFTAFVDFAFFTIPLKNSAITVKVWLYKSADLMNTYYLKIS